MYVCHKCGMRFGPNGPDDSEYEAKHNNMVVLQKFTEIWGIADSVILCPECGKAIWVLAGEEVKK